MERSTIQRKLIVDSIKSIGHATTKDIISSLSNSGYNVSIGTIYRNLDLLVNENILRRVSINFKEDYYELSEISTHNHFICEKCGKIIDIFNNNSSINEINGNKVISNTTTYYGICKECLENNKDYSN